MPEGDTVHKLARYMAPRLVDRPLQALEGTYLPRAITITDDSVVTLVARGKHLVIQFVSGRTLRVHLGMYGTWHHYALGKRWRRRPSTARIVLATDRDVFVCFRPTKVDLIQNSHLTAHPLHHDLGPDLIGPPISSHELMGRIQHYEQVSAYLDDLLLDQRIAAGIGNVYKSEILFIYRLNPRLKVCDVPDEILLELFDCARILLHDNLKGGPRITTTWQRSDLPKRVDSHLWVYGRKKEPCYRCGAPIRRAITGRQCRVTYWCATCQPKATKPRAQTPSKTA